jgi:hypothetical protein
MANSRACAVVYTLVVFLAGAVGGALTMNVLEHFWLHPQGINVPVSAASAPQTSEQHRYVEQFRKELNLTGDQSKELEAILDQTVRQVHDLHSFSYHIREDGIARIRAMLNDAQRKRFDEIVARRTQDDQARARKQAATK